MGNFSDTPVEMYTGDDPVLGSVDIDMAEQEMVAEETRPNVAAGQAEEELVQEEGEQFGIEAIEEEEQEMVVEAGKEAEGLLSSLMRSGTSRSRG